MKQILQNLATGRAEVTEVPCPQAQQNRLLIRSIRTLISGGTERMLLEFGKANFIGKVRQQPDKVRMVLDKIKSDGLIPTINAVRHKLGRPLALGYCNVGRVIAVGQGVEGFAVGDRVASNGEHAEVVSVPANLCVRIPEKVSDDEATFTVLAAVALQGIRLLAPTLGEAVVVTGLGLVGLMAVQLLLAHGCRVLALDLDAKKCALAQGFGAQTVHLSTDENVLAYAMQWSRGRGVDAVLIAAATGSSEPVRQAALMCRQRGRIVLVGVTGLTLSRADFYQKELTFQVSCSYGPGRYDSLYEEQGSDYPLGFVRWTAQRNFEAVLDMMVERRLQVASLISHRFAITAAEAAYAALSGDKSALGIVLVYEEASQRPDRAVRQATVTLNARSASSERRVVAFVGAGNYANSVLIPAFQAAGARLKAVAASTGLSASYVGRKFSAETSTTDIESLLCDPDIDALVITTRHNTHAYYVIRALESGKHVFVEKPLCLTFDELDAIETCLRALGERAPVLTIGFNRRYAPQVQKMKALLAGQSDPKALVMTVNAGTTLRQHWTQNPQIGGGRIIGEACHFIDLLRHLVGEPITGFHATALALRPTVILPRDQATITLQFADGSLGTLHYLTNGPKEIPKERLEVFCGGRGLRLDNFRKLNGYGWANFSRMNLWRQDKGQQLLARAFVTAIGEGVAPIPLDQLFEVSRVTLKIAQVLDG